MANIGCLYIEKEGFFSFFIIIFDNKKNKNMLFFNNII